jgi:ABC-type sugar transport system ATPase subunit
VRQPIRFLRQSSPRSIDDDHNQHNPPILEARGLTRSFGAVQALADADFEVYRGEVVALIGDNGAGKSTMVKALSATLL